MDDFENLHRLLQIEELVRHQPHLKNIKLAILEELKALDEEMGKDIKAVRPEPGMSGMPSSGPMSPNYVPAQATVQMPDAGLINPITEAPAGDAPATGPLGVPAAVPAGTFDSTPSSTVSTEELPLGPDEGAPIVSDTSAPLNRRV